MQNEKYSLPRGKSFLEKIGLKYMFDWGSGVCVWTTNDAGKERFKDYPVETSLLPISEELKNHLEHLISWYDEALDWDNPGGDLLWSEKQIAAFMESYYKGYQDLCQELGDEYEVVKFRDKWPV